MTLPHMGSRIAPHRHKSGLSQREIAIILGMVGEIAVSRHERSIAIPALLVAVGYEIIFNVPVAELFPGVYETVQLGIEERLLQLESQLQDVSPEHHTAASTARKLEWIEERRSNRQTN